VLGDSGEDLDGWRATSRLIERATIVGNGGPGVEGGAAGLMEVRDSIVFGNAFDLYQVGGPLGANLIGVDPFFTSDYRLSLASPAVGAAAGGGELVAFPMRECSNGADDDNDGSSADDGCPRPRRPGGVTLRRRGLRPRGRQPSRSRSRSRSGVPPPGSPA
jgi:hypothetical protein